MWTDWKLHSSNIAFYQVHDDTKLPKRGDICSIAGQECLFPWLSDPFGIYNNWVLLSPSERGRPLGWRRRRRKKLCA